MDYGRERKLCGDSVGSTPASARQSHGSRNPCRARSTAGSISSSSAVGGRRRVLLSGGERYSRCPVRNSDVPRESRSKSVARPTGASGARLRSVKCRYVKLIRIIFVAPFVTPRGDGQKRTCWSRETGCHFCHYVRFHETRRRRKRYSGSRAPCRTFSGGTAHRACGCNPSA